MVHEPYSAPPWRGVPLLVGTCRGRHPPQHTMRRSFPEQELVPQDSPPSGRWSMSRGAPFCRPSCLPSALKTHPQHGGTCPLGWVYQPPQSGFFYPTQNPGPGPVKLGAWAWTIARSFLSQGAMWPIGRPRRCGPGVINVVSTPTWDCDLGWGLERQEYTRSMRSLREYYVY